MAGLLHGQYLKFWQRISPVVVASDVLAGFYIKYCPGIVFVMARPFFITSEGKNLHNVPGYGRAMPMVQVLVCIIEIFALLFLHNECCTYSELIYSLNF